MTKDDFLNKLVAKRVKDNSVSFESINSFVALLSNVEKDSLINAINSNDFTLVTTILSTAYNRIVVESIKANINNQIKNDQVPLALVLEIL